MIWVRKILALIAALAVTAAVFVGGDLYLNGTGSYNKITAHFSAAVGLYKGSSVRVLGVSVGKVLKITPDGTAVTVEIGVKKNIKIPASAQAYIIPPSLISDRYVQLDPAYTSGAVMAPGADIPITRTHTPIELDTIVADLDKLFKGLGPEGANKDGALSRAVSTGAAVLKGDGGDVNTTLTQLSNAVETLANGGDDLGSIITNLASFSQVLAQSDGVVKEFTQDLGTASTQLAEQRKDLGLALKNLASALSQIGSLVKDHRDELTADVGSLSKISTIVTARQRELKEFLDNFPLLTTNIDDTIDLRTPGSISLPIRALNEQTGNVEPIVLCQIVSPVLGITCPVSGSQPVSIGANGVSGPPLELGTDDSQPLDKSTQEMSVGGEMSDG